MRNVFVEIGEGVDEIGIGRERRVIGRELFFKFMELVVFLECYCC